jgi:hypothetical protein
MAGQTLLQRIGAASTRPRARTIEWPLPVEGERPKLGVRALSAADREAAYFATVDYFAKDKKRKVAVHDPSFLMREQLEVIWRACSDIDGERIGASTDELAAETPELRQALYDEWMSVQADQVVRPSSAAEVDALVEELKKNSLAVPLDGCASSLLIGLVRTLASRLVTSETPISSG